MKDKHAELLKLLASNSKTAPRKVVDIIGTELARLAHEEYKSQYPNDRDLTLEEFMDGDEEYKSPSQALSTAGMSDGVSVFGLTVKYAGSNQARTEGVTVQEAYELWDESDPNKPVLLNMVRIEGWYSSYEGVEWDEDAIVFVDRYPVRIDKFYTPAERKAATDDFI